MRQDIHGSQVERFEAFCCMQVERVERALASRYAMDYDGRDDAYDRGTEFDMAPHRVMPQNDHVGRKELREIGPVTRGNPAVMGRQKGKAV